MGTFASFPDFSKKTTITAIRSGNASDPSIWDQNRPLQDGDWFRIPTGTTIVWDLTTSPRLGGFINAGTIDAGSASGAKEMKLGTGWTQFGATFQAGDCINDVEINGSLTITILNVATDPTFDPAQFGTGFLSTGGIINLCGSTNKTAWVEAAGAKAGQQSIALLSPLTGAQVNDQILVPGCFLSPVQDEVLTLQSISTDGLTLTFTTPLQYDHLPTPGPQGEVNNLPIGNLSRKIIFQSEDPNGTRGHCMFMRDMSTMQPTTVNVCHILVKDMGRTDATRPVTDPLVDASGVLVPGTADNPRARYAWHEHRQGQTDATGKLRMPNTWEGIVVWGYKKWGFDNHDSFVDAVGLVAYQGQGAGCATERGSELGTYTSCLSVRATGDGSTTATAGIIDARMQDEDWGWIGSGFWLQGPGVTVQNCVAAGCARSGILFYPGGATANPPLGVTAADYPAANLWTTLPRIAPGVDVPMRFVPLRGCANNTAFGCGEFGLHCWGQRPVLPTVLDSTTVWNTPQGVGLSYMHTTTVKNAVLSGPNGAAGSVGINLNNGYTSDVSIVGGSVGGYELGYEVPLIGNQSTIQGGFWANVRDFSFWDYQNGFGGGILMPPAAVKFTAAPTFGPVADSVLAGRPRQNYYLWKYAADAPGLPTNLWGYFVPYTITLADGRQLYFPEQGNGVVPFPSSKTWPDWFPAALKDQTNAQLWAKFGLATAGAAAPADATAMPNSNGLVGTAAAARPYEVIASPVSAPAGQPYFLSYYPADGSAPTVKETTASALTTGVNILTRTINGQTYSFLPYLAGTTPPPPPPPAGTTAVTVNAVQLRRVTLTASVTSSSGAVVNEGSVVFSVQQSGATVATATAAVANGKAIATVEIPVGAYSVQASYSDVGGALPASSGSVAVTAN